MWHKKDAATSPAGQKQCPSPFTSPCWALCSCLPALGQFVSRAAPVSMSPCAQVNARLSCPRVKVEAVSLLSACFLSIPGLCVGTGQDTVLLFYCQSVKADHTCNPNILSVSPCMIHFKHLYLQKLNTGFHGTSVASNTQDNALPQTFGSFIQVNQLRLLFFPHLDLSATDSVAPSVAYQKPICQLTSCCSANTYWHTFIPTWWAHSAVHKWVIGGTGLIILFSTLLQGKMQSSSEISSGINLH